MAADIMAVFRKSATGHIDLADRLTSAEIKITRQGLNLASLFTLLAFGSSIAFFALGNDVAGVAFLSVPVVMLIRSFIQRPDRRDRRGPSADRASDA